MACNYSYGASCKYPGPASRVVRLASSTAFDSSLKALDLKANAHAFKAVRASYLEAVPRGLLLMMMDPRCVDPCRTFSHTDLTDGYHTRGISCHSVWHFEPWVL